MIEAIKTIHNLSWQRYEQIKNRNRHTKRKTRRYRKAEDRDKVCTQHTNTHHEVRGVNGKK